MKTLAALFVFVFLTIFAVKGQPGFGSQRCLCQGRSVKMVQPKLIEKVVIHPVSPSCRHLEVVVTLKNITGLRCLNPKSLFVKNIIEMIAKKEEESSAKSVKWFNS
ncbi:C-X-C motif chemokine 11-1-like [Myxocyprinus asiaticus]|uniref:C-X-C motif chemokine 11-1-like n=1 Tax=Myxocyprinus asiaticus TaxID=70543 RepID=UPI002223C656|nr:C-X-C motif chemokine 11-1-like [Myxocyprinus asiaticus]